MIENICQKMKNFALADAIICPEWADRYFSYDAQWNDNEELASLRDGQGGQWFLWLSGELAGYKCVSPEDGYMEDFEQVIAKFPKDYSPFVAEPAFTMDYVTCIWHLTGTEWVKFGKEDVQWLIDIDNVSAWTSKDYCDWANEYYETGFELEDFENFFKNPESLKHAQKLNPETDSEYLQSVIDEIGLDVQVNTEGAVVDGSEKQDESENKRAAFLRSISGQGSVFK